jgi:tetratricopeptide (TPR) repeat protein
MDLATRLAGDDEMSSEEREILDQVIETGPAIERLRAIVPGGWRAVPRPVRRALERDDWTRALQEANAAYAAAPGELVTSLTYAGLLAGRGLLEEAQGIIRKAAAAHEGDMGVSLIQVDVLIQEGRAEVAAEIMDGLLALQSQHHQRWVLLGDMCLTIDHVDDAIRCFARALEGGCHDSEVAYGLSRLYLERGDLFDGAAAMDRAAQLAQKEPGLWMLSGQAWADVEQWDRVEEALARAAKLGDEGLEMVALRAQALTELGRGREAIKLLEGVIRRYPREAGLLALLGHAELEMGLPESAAQHYRRAAQLAPDDPEPLHGEARAVFELGDLEGALACAKRAVALAPELAEGHHNLGLIYAALSELDHAESALRDALRLVPGDPRYTVALAGVLIRQGLIEPGFALVEHAEEASAEALLEVAEALVVRGAYDRAAQLLTREVGDDAALWALVGAALRLVVAAASAGDVEAATAALDAARAKHADALPLVWDFEPLERVTLRLERGLKGRVEAALEALVG